MVGELLKNAWNGWLSFMGAGKMGALLLLGLLLCLHLGLGKDRKRELFFYSGFMAVLCICPFTAVLFMLYQTRFYDYEWIWTMVPMTAVIACCEVLFLDWYREREQSNKRKLLCMLAAILVLNLVSGRMGSPDWKVEDLGEERKAVQAVVSEMMEDEKDIVLWAPQKIMRTARSLDGNIKLLYGRNIWQEHLNAYSYDEYPDEVWELSVWMDMAERYGTVVVPVDQSFSSVENGISWGSTLDGRKCMEEALRLGADHILLPGNMSQAEVAQLGEAFSLRCETVEGYYLLKK